MLEPIYHMTLNYFEISFLPQKQRYNIVMIDR